MCIRTKLKIYAVTEGEYSDYHIVKVFDSMEKAQAFIDQMAREDFARILEYKREDKDAGRHTRVFKRVRNNDSKQQWVELTSEEAFLRERTPDYYKQYYQIEDYEVH